MISAGRLLTKCGRSGLRNNVTLKEKIMSTIEIREKLHQYIDTSTDDIVAAVFALFKTYNTLPTENADEEIYNKEIDKAIADIAAGEFYTHEEVKSSFRK